jgi:hypothetical protein
MWFSKKEDDTEKDDLKAIIKSLEKEKRTLKEDLADLKLKKKMESEDIKHMVKINNERKDIELEKEKIKLERQSADAIAKVKDSYRDKTEQQLEKQLVNMKGMYGEILERLPNYNVKHTIKEG